MKKFLPLFFAASLGMITLFAACDMTYIQPPTEDISSNTDDVSTLEGRSATEEEIQKMEEDGRYLKITSLPRNLQAHNITVVETANLAASVARIDTERRILVARDEEYSSAYIPLVYNSGDEFIEDGSLFIIVTIDVDARTRIVVERKTEVLVEFENGRGEFDVKNIPVPLTDPLADIFLTFVNLPSHIQGHNISNVKIWNQAGVNALNINEDGISVKQVGDVAHLNVPLSLINSNEVFTGTGYFYLSFELNIDAFTSFTLSRDADVTVYFVQGRAVFDVKDIPVPPIDADSETFLTFVNLPSHVQGHNISNVQIWNQAGVIASNKTPEDITVKHVGDVAHLNVPLSLGNSNEVFTGTGSFYITFDLNIDALTSFTLKRDDRVTVYFFQGKAVVDIATLTLKADARTFLTITNLPSHVQPFSISNVQVWLQAGVIAGAKDYSDIIIEGSNQFASMKVPLMFVTTNEIFTGTGSFYVTFDLNIDAINSSSITIEHKFLVPFDKGNAVIDSTTLPKAPGIPYLTISGLPSHTAQSNFSDVYIHNLAGRVARFEGTKSIIINQEESSVTALIPLVYNASASEYFRETGLYTVTFTINIDVIIQITRPIERGIPIQFTNGSGKIDLFTELGFFSGGLTNYYDGTSPLVIRAGTSFEINRSYVQLKTDTAVGLGFLNSNRSTVGYVYASQLPGKVEFEYSTTAPTFVQSKNGYYSGEKRALFKFIYIKEAPDDLYLAKKRIEEPFPSFFTYTLSANSNHTLSVNSTVASLSVVQNFSGTSNYPTTQITLTPGAYIIVANGAGGGAGGDGNSGVGGRGGDGGFVAELLIIGNAVTFDFFSGSGGYSVVGKAGPTEGTAGGGGGSGSAIYAHPFSFPGGYLLTAGGGGGGSGGTTAFLSFTPGGAGGAGGSIGAGSGGGGGISNDINNKPKGLNGGRGGGWSAGAGGNEAFTYGGGKPNDGINAESAFPFATGFSFAGNGNQYSSSGGNAAYANYHALYIDYRNTNNANGKGGNALPPNNQPAPGIPGGAGGNNRNSSRGGGAGGVHPGEQKGGDGSITVYRIL